MGMTDREVRDYLWSIKVLTEKRDKNLEQIEELRSVATNCVAPTDKEPIQSSGSGDKMANIVGRIADLTKEVDEFNKIIDDRKAFLTRMGSKLSNDRHKTYLKLRYLDRNGFYDVVMMMELSDSTVRRIDQKMVFALTDIINHNI